MSKLNIFTVVAVLVLFSLFGLLFYPIVEIAMLFLIELPTEDKIKAAWGVTVILLADRQLKRLGIH